ncbi:MAG: SMI1/KNR4 family protein [Nitriliruptorales bacterium]
MVGIKAEATCVKRLADAVGLTNVVTKHYNWDAVEASIGGIRLPQDYKQLVETFPSGRFQRFVNIIRPGDMNYPDTEYLGYYRHRLDDMRNARKDPEDPATFPYPIYPEDDGLLPWGDGPEGELFYWITSSPDPNEWPVVIADQTWTEWHSFSGTCCEFLLHVVHGQYCNNVRGVDLTEPLFEPRKPIRSGPAPKPLWDPAVLKYGERQYGERPHNDLGVLARALPSAGRSEAVPVKWNVIEEELGLSLPSDFKSFIDRFGAGVFCDIAIMGVDKCQGFDLLTFLRRNHELAVKHLNPQYASLTPFYPEPMGIVAWGITSEGRICGWGPNGQNSEEWGVVVADPFPKVRGVIHCADLSFSSFLLKYGGYYGIQSDLFSSEPWAGEMTFIPHLHDVGDSD